MRGGAVYIYIYVQGEREGLRRKGIREGVRETCVVEKGSGIKNDRQNK